MGEGAARRVLFLPCSLWKQGSESHNVTPQQAFPLRLLLDSCSKKAFFTLMFIEATQEQSTSRPKKRRIQRIPFVGFNCLDACWLCDCRTGLVCFHYFNSWIVMPTRTQNK